MQPKVQVPQWTRNQRALAWLSFGIFCLGFIVYMVGYTGNYWYVSPVMSTFPPKDWVTEGWRLNFGLFYLCFRDHCKYDMRQDYQIVMLIPKELGQFDAPLQILHLAISVHLTCFFSTSAAISH